MSKNVLEYRGYYTKIEYSREDCVLYGKIEGIVDLITFESDRADNIENEFHLAVDDYLDYCKETGKEPNKIFKGTFNVRISPELHRKASLLAYKNDESLNQIVEKAVDYYVNNRDKNIIEVNNNIRMLTAAVTINSRYNYYRCDGPKIKPNYYFNYANNKVLNNHGE